jgi:hypothetical protein
VSFARHFYFPRVPLRPWRIAAPAQPDRAIVVIVVVELLPAVRSAAEAEFLRLMKSESLREDR